MVPLVVDPGCKGTMALSACWLGFAFRGPMLVSIPHAHTCDGNQEVVVLVSKLRACIDRACVNKCVCVVACAWMPLCVYLSVELGFVCVCVFV